MNQSVPSPAPTTGLIGRVVGLAWPIIGLNVLQVLSLAVDTMMVGQVPNAEVALTGMGYATQLAFLLAVAMIGLTVGTVAFIARAHGAGLRERVDHILQQSTQLTIVLGLLVAVVGNLAAPWLLYALGANEAATAAGLDYLRPLLTFTAFNYLNILFAATLRGVGNTRLAFVVSLVMNALNVVFNYGLILGNYGLPALGIQGAALGTVMSQATAALLMFVLLWRGVVPGIRARIAVAKPDGKLARDLVRIGTPAAIDMVVLNAAMLAMIGMLGRIDQAAVAAHGIGLRVQGLAFVPGMSISQATGAIVGQALGRNNVDEARRTLHVSLVLATVVMSVLAIPLVLNASAIVELFSVAPGTPVHAFSVTWMRLLGFGMPVVGLYIAFVGLFQGSGSTWTSLRINATTTFLIQIPLSYILGFPLGLGAMGVWMAFPLTFVAKLLWGVLAYRRGSWAQTGSSV